VATLPLYTMVSGCNSGAIRFPDYRYRLTLEVDTPEGMRFASSVRQIQTYQAGKHSIPDPGKIENRTIGEALVLDLGKRGTLFALLSAENHYDWSSTIMPVITPTPNYVKGEDKFLKRFNFMMTRRQLIELPREPIKTATFPFPNYPWLVQFTRDRDWVEQVNPSNLAASLGKGVSLRRMTVQLTDDPVTIGIGRALPWLATWEGRLSGRIGSISYPRFADLLDKRDFKRTI
jgi:hypothetical protein